MIRVFQGFNFKCNVPEIIKELDCLNKKLGAEVFTINITKEDYDETAHIEYVEFEVCGEVPCISGFEVVGLVNHRTHIITSFLDDTLDLTQFRYTNYRCDHCGKNTDRVKSFVIRNTESGELLQVGSSCIDYYSEKKYTDAVNHIMQTGLSVNSFSTFDELAEEVETQSGVCTFRFATVAWIANYMIKKYGFTSVKSETETVQSTKRRVVKGLFEPIVPYDYLSKSEESDKFASEVKEFISQSKSNNFSSYLDNCKTICEMHYVEVQHIGFIVSMVNSYLNYLKEKNNSTNSYVHFENLGVRVKTETEVKIVNRYVKDTEFGVSTVFWFEDSKNHLLTWTTQSLKMCIAEKEIGDTMTIKAFTPTFNYTMKNNTLNATKITRVTF